MKLAGKLMNRRNRGVYTAQSGWKKTTLSKRALSVFISFAFIWALAGQTGLFTYIIGRINQANQTPHALSSNASLQYAPATDSSPSKVATSSAILANELAKEKSAQQKGKPINQKHIKLLTENRSTNSKEYLNADGSKSLVYTASATSYKDQNGDWQNIDNTLVKGLTEVGTQRPILG